MPFSSERLEDGVGLALSGGGFRASLFHVGSLWRLNELGWLGRISRVSSVSGGSITAGVLVARWGELRFENDVATNFATVVAEPLRGFCCRGIDIRAVVFGLLHPLKRASDILIRHYDRYLFHGVTLQDLPDRPRLVINATNLQTGRLFRMSKPYAADYLIGQIEKPRFSLSMAVAASSAFPPFLSPVVLPVEYRQVVPLEGSELHESPGFIERIVLADGGIYDNLALETIWNRYRTILVSDGGAPAWPKRRISKFTEVLRANDLVTDQARSMRKRALVDAYARGRREGAYWGINTEITDYPIGDALPCAPQKRESLARIGTRLSAFDERCQEELINWGYALSDAALRGRVHAEGSALPPGTWPYPRAALG